MAAKARVTGEQEIAAITELVEPWMIINGVGWPYTGLIDIAAGPYEIDAIVKQRDLEQCETAADVRAKLLANAEAMLSVLAEAGWQPAPLRMTMTFTTEVRSLTQTFAGEMVLPAQQRGIRLEMKFSVDRAR